MKHVAARSYVEQAVADMGSVARAFLERLHRGEVIDARGEATLHLHRLHDYAQLHGASLDDMTSYEVNGTIWRAITRLAGSVVETTRAG